MSLDTTVKGLVHVCTHTNYVCVQASPFASAGGVMTCHLSLSTASRSSTCQSMLAPCLLVAKACLSSPFCSVQDS